MCFVFLCVWLMLLSEPCIFDSIKTVKCAINESDLMIYITKYFLTKYYIKNYFCYQFQRLNIRLHCTVLHKTFCLPFFSSSGLYSNDTCTPVWDCVCPNFLMTSGGICPVGYFCPMGSSKPTACNAGEYCATPGLPLPTGELIFVWLKVSSIFMYLAIDFHGLVVDIIILMHNGECFID